MNYLLLFDRLSWCGLRINTVASIYIPNVWWGFFVVVVIFILFVFIRERCHFCFEADTVKTHC